MRKKSNYNLTEIKLLSGYKLTKPLTPKTMGKYLKQGFVRALEWQHAREEISYSKMVELMEEECIKNYKAEFEETFNTNKK